MRTIGFALLLSFAVGCEPAPEPAPAPDPELETPTGCTYEPDLIRGGFQVVCPDEPEP